MSTDDADARRAALTGLIDDAAMFPPARLPLPEAVAQHVAHRDAPYAWLVGRFLCPASQIDALPAALGAGRFTAVSVVCDGPASSPLPFADALREDLERAAAASGGDVRVEALEVPLRVGEQPADLLLESVLATAQAAGLPPGVEPFCELPVAGHPHPEVAAAVAALSAGRLSVPRGRVGAPVAKVRCGGPDPALVPQPDELAGFLVACRDGGVPFKATAGLHHPRPHPRPDGAGAEHGFLNLLAAAGLALVEGADAGTLADILVEDDPDALRLDADGLHTAGGALEAAALAETREALFVSYGSCSLEEPVAGLAALGILAPDGSPA